MNRVISDGPDDFDDFINNHDKMQDEVYELEQLAEEALQLNDHKALMQIKMALQPLKKEIENFSNSIKVHFVGRLVRPKKFKNLLYEV